MVWPAEPGSAKPWLSCRRHHDISRKRYGHFQGPCPPPFRIREPPSPGASGLTLRGSGYRWQERHSRGRTCPLAVGLIGARRASPGPGNHRCDPRREWAARAGNCSVFASGHPLSQRRLSWGTLRSGCSGRLCCRVGGSGGAGCGKGSRWCRVSCRCPDSAAVRLMIA